MNFRKKILLVDYEPHVTALVRRELEATGDYEVKEQHDSRLALNAARWFQPDLVLFDLAFARPEAAAVVRQMQEDPSLKDTPVMFVRVDTTPEGGLASGGILNGYSFLAHPVSIGECVRYVREVLRPKRTRNLNRQDALAA